MPASQFIDFLGKQVAAALTPAGASGRLWRFRLRFRHVQLSAIAVSAAATLVVPHHAAAAAAHVASSLLEVAPLLVPGILLSAWVTASGASGRVARFADAGGLAGIALAAAVGAATPVCGITTLPLTAGLLAAGVPLAPVMAFWLSSPVTDPAMLGLTAATLGMEFAVGKTLAAFGLGLFGGIATASLAPRRWTASPLRRTDIPSVMPEGSEPCGGSAGLFRLTVWRDPRSRSLFMAEARYMTRLVLLCLVPAFAAEYGLGLVLTPESLAGLFGSESSGAIPLAVLIGAPAYIDGYAALPLVRSMMEHGLAPGAAMAFLVSGSVVSIWGALAIFPVLRVRPFLLYLILAVIGSMASGWLYGWAVGP